MSNPYISVTGIETSDILNCNIEASHNAAVSIAVVACIKHSLTIGDYVEIDIGLETEHSVEFRGYVRQITRDIPSNTYQIELQNILIRAADYFIAGAPDDPLTYSDISAESLVATLLAMAGLTNFASDTSYFTFGVAGIPVEVNLVSVLDYCRQVETIIAWKLWYDAHDDMIYFKERLPYPGSGITPSTDYPSLIVPSGILLFNIQPYTGEPEEVVVEGIPEIDPNNPYNPCYPMIGITDAEQYEKYIIQTQYYNPVVVPSGIIPSSITTVGTENFNGLLQYSYGVNDRDLRDKVAVYGVEGVSYTAGSGNRAVVFSSELIGSKEIAQMSAIYNLQMLNKLSYVLTLSCAGRSFLTPGHLINVTLPEIGTDVWYIYSASHNYSPTGGYIVDMELRR